MSAPTRWSQLLAEPEGRGGVHARTLRLAQKEAAGQVAGALEAVISGADEALAAIALLRGPEAVREFPRALARVVAGIGRELEMFPDGIADRSVLGLYSLTTIAEAIGAPLDLPAHDVAHRFQRFLTNKVFTGTERITIALLALDLSRPDDARFVVKSESRKARAGAGAGSLALVKLLSDSLESGETRDLESAWNAWLRGFPQALANGTTEWRQLMLAARIMGRMAGLPAQEVAGRLHRRIEEIAAEDQSA